MDSIASFYNNLFTIEIAAFGIIAAAIFVFLQIVYSQFSYREVYWIFKNVSLILYLIISIATLLLTAAGSLILSFPELNPISVANDSAVNNIFENWVAASFLLFSFLFSIALFAVFTLSNISNLRPSRVALLISRKVSNDQIKNYLLKKHGIPAPDDWIFLLEQYGGDFASIYPTGLESDEKHEISKKELARIEAKKQQFEKTLSENKRTYEKAKKAVEHARDPMEQLDALMLKAINNVDLATIDEIQSVFLHVSANFLSTYNKHRDSKEWSPHAKIIRNYLEYLIELFEMHLSMCDRQKLDPVKVRILETSEQLANQVITANDGEISIILEFWKVVADNAIGKSPEVFGKVIQLYRGLADYAFDKGIENKQNWLDEIFRHLGWLGERLITKYGIEEKPLMLDHYYSNEYDKLFEALMSYSYEYDNKYPNSYPLIYFDAVDVIFLQLTATFRKTKTQGRRLKENIFSCLYTYSSFAQAAIPKENSSGAALAVLRLKEGYDKLVNEDLEESAKEALG